MKTLFFAIFMIMILITSCKDENYQFEKPTKILFSVETKIQEHFKKNIFEIDSLECLDYLTLEAIVIDQASFFGYYKEPIHLTFYVSPDSLVKIAYKTLTGLGNLEEFKTLEDDLIIPEDFDIEMNEGIIPSGSFLLTSDDLLIIPTAGRAEVKKIEKQVKKWQNMRRHN